MTTKERPFVHATQVITTTKCQAPMSHPPDLDTPISDGDFPPAIFQNDRFESLYTH